MASQKNDDLVATVVGAIILLALLGGATYGIHRIVSAFEEPAPTALVSLSAYFVDDAGKLVDAATAAGYAPSHIRIEGEVDRNGQPVGDGRVRITATIRDKAFDQSVTVPLVKGAFFTEAPAFRFIHPGDRAVVTADVSAQNLNQVAKIELNTRSPISQTGVEIAFAIAFLLLVLIFFYAFTGPQTTGKNRVAIVFSYIVIGLFLAVPVLAPVMLLRYFPEEVNAMIGQPAGLINTHTANQSRSDETQWALNIGGYSYVQPPQSVPQGSESVATPPDRKTVDTAHSNTSVADGVQTQTAASRTPAQPSTAATVAPAKSSHQPQSASADAPGANPKPAIAQTPTAAAAPDAAAGGATPVLSSPSGVLEPPKVNVEGGLIIPLYVIVLSVIGGAINMTRKVPGFQREGEASSDIRLVPRPSRVGAFVMRQFTQLKDDSAAAPAILAALPDAQEGQEQPAPAPATDATEDRINAIDEKLDALLSAQLTRKNEGESAVSKIRSLVQEVQSIYAQKGDNDDLDFKSFDAWYASHPGLREVLGGNWRVELLNQYMYLISAPFLAVVAYYILDLLAVTKEGVVVVISFSVGLISEKIVGWILGIATGYMTNPSAKPAK
ncbi:MAG: hypothetical protein ABSD96_23035 [Candidatus Korobacteraceae bacterium]